MEKATRDGWQKLYDNRVCEYDVYVEGGIVTYCIRNGRIAYPYRVYTNGGWDKDTHMTLDEVQSGLLIGSVIIT